MSAPAPQPSGPGAAFDRAAVRRKDKAWLAEALRTPGSRIVPFWQGKHLVTGPREAPVPAFIDPAESWWRAEAEEGLVFLGLATGVAHFAADLSRVPDPKTHPVLAERGAFVDLRTLAPVLAADAGQLFGYARGVLLWHQRHRYCAVCGSPTRMDEGGHVRRCVDPDCGASHFPRTDPVVIMLIADGDRCLLGRQPKFPPGFFSCLAGFVESGEGLEEAVAREAMEEAGVSVSDIRYHSSQPWPFPASLMMAFTARATSFDIIADPEEMEEVRWFDRAWIKANAGTDAFRLPPRDAIARTLIEDWLKAED